jgi:hypothetical protein
VSDPLWKIEKGAPTVAELTLTITPRLSGASVVHPAVESALHELVADAQHAAGVKLSIVDREATPGHKGTLQEVALALTAPGAVAGVVQIFRLWLGRDRRRSIDVSINRPGQDPVELHVSGDGISLDALQKAVDSAIQADEDTSEDPHEL